MFEIGKSYKLTHEYIGKIYKTFYAKLIKVTPAKDGLTRLTFKVDEHREFYFFYPISKKKKYGIIKIEE